MLSMEIWQGVFGQNNVYRIFRKINSSLLLKNYSYYTLNILYYRIGFAVTMQDEQHTSSNHNT